MNGILRTVRNYGRMVRFSHSVFALPFAFASVVSASLSSSLGPWQIVWILVAMLAVRNAAISFNRLADAAIDARNPRNEGCGIPRGFLGKTRAALHVAALSAPFVADHRGRIARTGYRACGVWVI